MSSPASPALGVARGAALYVGALMGPGVLLVPALAVEAAGPASVVAWGTLLLLSIPLAATFAVLGVRHPVAGGVTSYVGAGFGPRAAAITGVWFLCAVLLGVAPVALIGGFYVADLTGGGTSTAVATAMGIVAAVLTANALGLRVSSAVQLGLSAVLVVILAVAIGSALPTADGAGWVPFAPHGWLAVGTAASLLVWHFVGWEAMAQMAGDFRDPRRDLPRAMGIAYAVIALLYVGLAVATVQVSGGNPSRVPLADLLGAGLGEAARTATAVLAVALTMGTMNVYCSGAAKLARALAQDGALPAWFTGGGGDDVPHRPLLVIAASAGALLAAMAAELVSTADMVRVTSAFFVAVYVIALVSAVRILTGVFRTAAAVALGLMLGVTVFSSWFLLAPATAAAATVLVQRRVASRRVCPIAG